MPSTETTVIIITLCVIIAALWALFFTGMLQNIPKLIRKIIN